MNTSDIARILYQKMVDHPDFYKKSILLQSASIPCGENDIPIGELSEWSYQTGRNEGLLKCEFVAEGKGRISCGFYFAPLDDQETVWSINYLAVLLTRYFEELKRRCNAPESNYFEKNT